MPILEREIDLFPVDLLSQPRAEGVHWWALYTFPRREKELMRQLVRYQVPFYSPVVEKKTRSPLGRVRTSYVPLFSNYVFLCSDDDGRIQALKTNCVLEAIRVQNEEELIGDLQTIHSLIETRASVTLESKLKPGRKVRVKTGPLAGREGMIQERRGAEHLVVVLNFLQQGASVLLDDFIVEAID